MYTQSLPPVGFFPPPVLLTTIIVQNHPENNINQRENPLKAGFGEIFTFFLFFSKNA